VEQVILSTGIDIGTSTTQLIFSRLTIQNLASSYTVPNISIVDKQVVYRSDIYFTPLISDTEIDAESIKRLVLKEYERSGFKPSQIETGAVIITGETARKANANHVLESLAGLAGDFVVATAGPALEAVLSAKGAGTDEISHERRQVLANIDVGGGTSNYAVFDRGELREVACIDIGGRLVRLHQGKIEYIAPPIQRLAERHGLKIYVGMPIDRGLLRRLCDKMADALLAAVNLCEAPSGELEDLSTNGEPLLSNSLKIQGITFSGGVADCLYNPGDSDDFRYGDIGPLLARAISEHPALKQVTLYPVAETIRATVVGAGSHTMEVSGSTIAYAADQLPMKNVPILRVPAAAEEELPQLEEAILRLLPLFMPEGKPELVAISVTGEIHTSFTQIQAFASTLIRATEDLRKAGLPLLIICKNDIGKALGHALNVQLEHKTPVLCIDGIQTLSGDYIDIGNPIAEGRVVPVVIKTLVFNNARS